MNKVLTLAAILCMSTSGVAFSADDMMKDAAKDAVKQEAKSEANKAMDKEMPKDAKAAKEMGKEAAQHPYKEITASELKSWMDKKEQMVLIDARDKKTFEKGHIEGAMNLAPDQITKEEMAKVAKSMDDKLVFYCGSATCPASKKAAEEAAKLGYTNVYKVPGGFAEWEKEGYKATTKM